MSVFETLLGKKTTLINKINVYQVFTEYEKLLNSENYVTKRQSLKVRLQSRRPPKSELQRTLICLLTCPSVLSSLGNFFWTGIILLS